MTKHQLTAARVRAMLIKNGLNKAAEAHQRFGSRGPDVKTLKKVYIDDPTIKQSTLEIVVECLRHPDLPLYEELKKSFNVKAVDEANVLQLAGAYRYHRPGVSGAMEEGGIFVSVTPKMARFYHCGSRSAFDRFREEWTAVSPDPDRKVSTLIESDVPPSGQGFVFSQSNERFLMVGVDSEDLRTVHGLTVSDPSSKYLRGLVLARNRGGVIFSTKTFLVHESNKENFDRHYTEERVRDILQLSAIKNGFLTP